MLFKGQKQQKPRGFTYKSRYWDAEKEEFQNRVQDAQQRYHGENNQDYKPGKHFDFRKTVSPATQRVSGNRYETRYGKVNPFRLLVLIAILSGLVAYIYLSA